MPQSMMTAPKKCSPNVMASASPPNALAAHDSAATYSYHIPRLQNRTVASQHFSSYWSSSSNLWHFSLSPANRIKHAKKCVVTKSNVVYLSIVVTLNEMLTFVARRETNRPKRNTRRSLGSRSNLAIL